MKLLTTTLALALALPATALAQTPPLATEYRAHGDDARILVAAHRGYWRGAPENSLPAFEQAIGHGADMIELDVMRTSDGQLVLMHDTTVDRTTNGTGSVASKTLAQIKALRLKKGLGGAQAEVTGEQVPTLKEALQLIDNRALINLDKAWGYRDQILQELLETGTVETAVFKSNAAVAEVQAFRAKDPRILYSHIVEDGNAASLNGFGSNPPDSYEIVFDRLTDPQIQPAAVAAAKQLEPDLHQHHVVRARRPLHGRGVAGRPRPRLEAGHRAPPGRRHPDRQRGRPQALPARDRRHAAGQPGERRRVQGEDYSTDGKGVGYADTEDANQGGNLYRGAEGVDVCDQQGALVVCWIRGGEWLKYDIEIKRPARTACGAASRARTAPRARSRSSCRAARRRSTSPRRPRTTRSWGRRSSRRSSCPPASSPTTCGSTRPPTRTSTSTTCSSTGSRTSRPCSSRPPSVASSRARWR